MTEQYEILLIYDFYSSKSMRIKRTLHNIKYNFFRHNQYYKGQRKNEKFNKNP